SRDSTTLPEPLAKLQITSVEKDLQGQRTSLETKMKVIGVCLSDKGLNFGAAPLQDLTKLISLRNFLVHSRPEQLITESAVTNEGIATDHQVELRSLGTFLVRRRVTPRSRREILIPLLTVAQMPSVAIWAHNTVVESIRTLLVLFPNDGWRSILGSVANYRKQES